MSTVPFSEWSCIQAARAIQTRFEVCKSYFSPRLKDYICRLDFVDFGDYTCRLRPEMSDIRCKADSYASGYAQYRPGASAARLNLIPALFVYLATFSLPKLHTHFSISIFSIFSKTPLFASRQTPSKTRFGYILAVETRTLTPDDIHTSRHPAHSPQSAIFDPAPLHAIGRVASWGLRCSVKINKWKTEKNRNEMIRISRAPPSHFS